MISRTAEYALRAVVFLARRNETPAANAEIAEATQVPVDYLSKVMRLLGRAKLVHSRPGPNGGFTLARNPGDLPLLAVINAVDPIERIHECPLGVSSHRQLCPLHQRLDEAAGLVESAFGGTTVAELVASPPQRRACAFPCRDVGVA